MGGGLSGRPLREAHLEALSRLVRSGQSGGAVRLPAGGTVERGRGRTSSSSREIFLRVASEPRGFTASAMPLQVPGQTERPRFVRGGGREGLLRRNGDASPGCVVSRLRLGGARPPSRDPLPPAGDHLRPFGFDGTKSLKKLFIEARVPQNDRDRIPVVTARGEIVWVVGHRRGASAPIRDGSRQILLLEARGVEGRGTEGER